MVADVPCVPHEGLRRQGLVALAHAARLDGAVDPWSPEPLRGSPHRAAPPCETVNAAPIGAPEAAEGAVPLRPVAAREGG